MRFIKMNRLIFFILAVSFASCSENSTEESQPIISQPAAPEPVEVITDTFIIKLQPILTNLIADELNFLNSNVSGIKISNIRYRLISPSEYYKLQYDSLKAQQHLSVDNDKTNKALTYLEKMTVTSGTAPEFYEAKFHFNALAGKLNYNEEKTVYLKKNMTRIVLKFPN